jgi:hypothetical protein
VGLADLAGNQGRCGTRRPFCRGNCVPVPPSRGLSSEDSGPGEGNSYAGVMGGSSRLECSTVSRRPSPPRNTKCASLGTRSPGVHRGSPDCICWRTSRLRSAAVPDGRHQIGEPHFVLGSKPSLALHRTSVSDGTGDPRGESVRSLTKGVGTVAYSRQALLLLDHSREVPASPPGSIVTLPISPLAVALRSVRDRARARRPRHHQRVKVLGW